MSKYRKVDVRIWNDARFRALPDDAKLLFLFVLTHPNLTVLGAVRHNLFGMSGELGWSLRKFVINWNEIVCSNMILHDPKSCFIWLPNFLKYNAPQSPNVVKTWESALDLLPECQLKQRLMCDATVFVDSKLSEAFREALPKVFRESLPKDPVPASASALASVVFKEKDTKQKNVRKNAREVTDSPHQVIINRFLELKGSPRASLASAQVTGAYKRHSRAALSLIAEAGGLDHARAALECAAAYFDHKRLSWTLDTVAKHLPNLSRYGQELAAANHGLTRHQVEYLRQLAAWYRSKTQPSGAHAVSGVAPEGVPDVCAGPGVRVADVG